MNRQKIILAVMAIVVGLGAVVWGVGAWIDAAVERRVDAAVERRVDAAVELVVANLPRQAPGFGSQFLRPDHERLGSVPQFRPAAGSARRTSAWPSAT